MQIVGAGLAGLIAASVFPNAKIIEAQGREKIDHKALLRFRSDVVSKATGIEFRKVKVHKGIWFDGAFRDPNIQLANLYSRKVIGRLADSSIWNIEPADRYIAPEDFTNQLIDGCGDRISWNTSFDPLNREKDEPIISTMPMPALSSLLADRNSTIVPGTNPAFRSKPINVQRYRVDGADTFQTIYFPERRTSIYRASITKDLLIVESIGEQDSYGGSQVMEAFAIFGTDRIAPLDCEKQSFGKIDLIDDVWRRNFILRASIDHNIYSVGRFATWKNILLDDVVQDLDVVKRLIKMGSVYHNRLKS